MESEVARAALAMVQPTTDPLCRREASRFLEEWTKTPEAIGVYAKWLASYRQQDKSIRNVDANSSYQIPMQMLCLTMLQSKLRNEMLGTTNTEQNKFAVLRMELWEYLRQQPTLDRSLMGPCCICNAITMVRSEAGGSVAEFITNSSSGSVGLPPVTTFRLLASIPSEMKARQDLTTSQVRDGLQLHLEAVLDLIRRGLSGDTSTSTMLAACQALEAWSEISGVSLTQLNTPTCGGKLALLPILVDLLSSSDPNTDTMIIQVAARALTTIILVTSDSGTHARQAAAASFWMAIPQTGFIINPLRVATKKECNDTAHALATLLSTFLIENVEDIVSQPASIGLQALLEVQSHSSTSVALIPLECWLTIQEIPTSDRHEHWTKSLYKNLLEILLERLAYPINFTHWENELEDSSDFFDFRRMAQDVLVSCYYLLRIEMIQALVYWVRTAADWRMSEAALSALSQISKDVCARCKSQAAENTIIAHDRQATRQALLELVDQLITVDSQITLAQPLLKAVVSFCGNYSPAWNSMDCPPQAILKILSYLQSAYSSTPLEAAKATRAIHVSCLAKNIANLDRNDKTSSPASSSTLLPILKSLRTSMEAILSTTDEEAMTTIAEGTTRVLTKISNSEMVKQAITANLIQPVIDRIDAALKVLPETNIAESWMTVQVQSAIDHLVRYLAVIRIIIRFCDSPQIPAITEWMLHSIDPCLKIIQQRTASTPAQPVILNRWILIHQQILRKSLPQQSTTITIFTNTIPLMVQALEQTQDPSTVKYISTAVEAFGGQTLEMDKSFQDLLVHITGELQRNGNLFEAELLQAYFECLQRFILYCPRALCYNPKLSEIVNIAVGSVSDIKETTRAALVFLSQLFGWKSLRLSTQTTNVLQEAWDLLILKEIILRHGQTLILSCFVGLSGGSTMLWPAYADCIFATVQAITFNEKENTTSSSNPSDKISPLLNEALIQQWLSSGIAKTFSTSGASSITADTNSSIINKIIPTLVALARDGSKSRSKGRMLLTDYAKIRKGEMDVASLVSYEVP